jgi:sulfite reductase alpha subunit-like flavoprotein
MLFFGCRSEAGDYYFRQEWEALVAAGLLAPNPHGLVTAFSRDGPTKVYVQQRIRERGAEVWRLLHQQGAWLYVAGSADKMPGQVAAVLAEVAVRHGGLSPAEAAALLRRWELSGRYQVEAWS